MDPIDEYIGGFPAGAQGLLKQLRTLIRSAAPDATERISYAVPTFHLKKNLVHFAAFKNHVGFYPGPSAMERFADELRPFKTGKGSVQFPLDAELPEDLIGRVVEFRVSENLAD